MASEKDMEKRNFVRLVYPADNQPVLKIADNEFKILNICQTGLKFVNHTEEHLGPEVVGTVIFQRGGTIEIDGKICWEQDREIGLFVANIPPFIVKQEIRSFIRQESDEKTLELEGAWLEPAKEDLQIEEE